MVSDKKYVIIVAGGSGSRMKSGIPKQFLILKGLPVLMRTINVFKAYDANISVILVLPEEQIHYWNELCTRFDFKVEVKIVKGGETRFNSVKNGLEAIEGVGVVGVHDGVRPFVSIDTITDAYKKAATMGTAVPVLDMHDSLRFADENTNYAVNRDNLKVVQTPQVFKIDVLKNAYNKEYAPEFTDDASVVERAGNKIELVKGNVENIKITTPFDLKIGEVLINEA
jgi:2-C-methyl-D-erythritol 4-phosphate cytidylyltransferase